MAAEIVYTRRSRIQEIRTGFGILPVGIEVVESIVRNSDPCFKLHPCADWRDAPSPKLKLGEVHDAIHHFGRDVLRWCQNRRRARSGFVAWFHG